MDTSHKGDLIWAGISVLASLLFTAVAVMALRAWVTEPGLPRLLLGASTVLANLCTFTWLLTVAANPLEQWEARHSWKGMSLGLPFACRGIANLLKLMIIVVILTTLKFIRDYLFLK